MVLDDDDGVAFVHEAVEDVDEAFYVGHVEADGALLDEVEVALGDRGVGIKSTPGFFGRPR